MARYIMACMLVLAIALPGSISFAADKDSKVKEYDFEGDTITTEALKPDMGIIDVLSKRKKESLVEIRTDFLKEIIKSAEDL